MYKKLFVHIIRKDYIRFSLKGKQSQCLDDMGLTELIKSNNFQQQSYF